MRCGLGIAQQLTTNIEWQDCLVSLWLRLGCPTNVLDLKRASHDKSYIKICHVSLFGNHFFGCKVEREKKLLQGPSSQALWLISSRWETRPNLHLFLHPSCRSSLVVPRRLSRDTRHSCHCANFCSIPNTPLGCIGLFAHCSRKLLCPQRQGPISRAVSLETYIYLFEQDLGNLKAGRIAS